MSSRAVLSLGANLGDRAAALRSAVQALKDDGVLVARSTLYETPPWGPVEQPPYLNAVVVVRGDRDAAGWLARALHSVLTGEPVDLLETLAQRLADVCLEDPLVDAVEITVHKPEADLGVPFDDVTVAIRRERP